MEFKVLIVEDNLSQACFLKDLLESLGMKSHLAMNVADGLRELSKNMYQWVFIDYQLPDGYGISLLKLAREGKIKLPKTVMMTAYASISRAVEAVKLGAFDFLEKPIKAGDVEKILQQGKADGPTDSNSEKDAGPRLLYGDHSPMREVMELCKAVAGKNCSIFLSGESGSGKEMLAEYIHHSAHKNSAPLVAVNCGAVVETLFESEFFGHKKGAFTGAVADKPGVLSMAEGGTLFLDEIGDLPFYMQTKLLRALQEKKITPVGGTHEINVDFRLISATHKNLQSLLNQGLFREDLFFRIHVVKIKIPPLRERKMDIPILLRHFLEKPLGKEASSEIIENLPSPFIQYPWPGNVRELKNFCEKFLVFNEIGKSLMEVFQQHSNAVHHFDPEPQNYKTYALPKSLSNGEILEALRLNDHHRQKTADYLGISRRSLQYRLAQMSKGQLN